MNKWLVFICAVFLSLQINAQELAKPVAIKLMQDKLTIRVMSNGCTNAKSFKLNWLEDELSIYRNAPDKCRRMPHLVWITLSIDNSKYPFSIKNKIYPDKYAKAKY